MAARKLKFRVLMCLITAQSDSCHWRVIPIRAGKSSIVRLAGESRRGVWKPGLRCWKRATRVCLLWGGDLFSKCRPERKGPRP